MCEDPDAVDTSAVVDVTGSGGGYNSVSGTVTVLVDDDDSSGLTLSRRSVPVDEGDSETFTVKLATQPTARVTITAVSRDTSTVTVTTGASLTFTTSELGHRADGDGVRCARTPTPPTRPTVVDLDATGGGYSAHDSTVTVNVTDDDDPPVTGPELRNRDAYSRWPRATTETFTVKLSADPEPTADRGVPEGCNLNGASWADVSAFPRRRSLTFTTSNWAAAQTVDGAGRCNDSADADGESVKLSLREPAHRDVSVGNPQTTRSVSGTVDRRRSGR